MTPIDQYLSTRQAIADAATKGDWEHRELTNSAQVVTTERGAIDIALMSPEQREERENAAFIADARTSQPALIEMVRVLKEALGKYADPRFHGIEGGCARAALARITELATGGKV